MWRRFAAHCAVLNHLRYTWYVRHIDDTGTLKTQPLCLVVKHQKRAKTGKTTVTTNIPGTGSSSLTPHTLVAHDTGCVQSMVKPNESKRPKPPTTDTIAKKQKVDTADKPPTKAAASKADIDDIFRKAKVLHTYLQTCANMYLQPCASSHCRRAKSQHHSQPQNQKQPRRPPS